MIDKVQIYKWWDVFKNGKDLTEIRILEGNRTYSGYFKNIDSLIHAIEPFDSNPNVQFYFTLNHIKEGCYSRRCEKMVSVMRDPTTSDVDIDGRTHILIDLDPIRPAGVSSSDEELGFAYKKAVDIYNFLLSQGFNEPIVCKSGNGYHITIPCQIAATAESTDIIKKFLQVLSITFSDENVEVDEKVFNLARICKLPGTQARKGENTSIRPWRISEIVKVPDEIKPTDIAYFKKIAALYPEEEVKPNRYNGYSSEKFDLVEFLNKHSIGYKAERVAGGTKYILDHCPFNDQHKHKDAVIFQRDSGAIGFICLHNSCADKTWRDVRMFYEPDAYSREYQATAQNYKQNYQQPTIILPQPLLQTADKGKIWLRMSNVKKPKIDPKDYVPSGIPLIDKRGLGFRRGHVTVWTGFRGCGKSSLLNQLILNGAQKGMKNALWTGELTESMVKQWLYLQAAGKRYNRRYGQTDYYYTPDHIAEKIDKWIDKYFCLFNNKYGDNFMQISEQLRQLKDEDGLDSAFLDNLMVLNYRELDQDKFERQGVLLQKLEDLAKELEIHIHLVAHPNKASGFLRVDNISGSGDISNKADNVMILNRVNMDFRNNAPTYIGRATFNEIIESGCTNCIEIAKFRDKGSLVGSFIKLWFEFESNRLKNDIAENVNYNWDDMPVESDLPFAAADENETLPF